MVDIIFAVNDPFKGPKTILYETNEQKDPNLALKVSVKAQLTLSLMAKEMSAIRTSDAVLPFPDLQKTAFSFLFTMNGENGSVSASISYLVHQNDNMNLYKNIPDLKEKLNYIVSMLQNWTYKSNTELPKNLYDSITGILLYETDNSYKPEVDLTNLITVEKSTGAPDYLIKKITKNLDHLFFDLYIGKPIVVVGKSKIAVEYAMATIDFLTPTKKIKKIIFSENYIDPSHYLKKVDVFGVSSVHEKRYKDYLVVDVDKFEIKNAKGKRPYFQSFMDDIIRIPASSAVQDIINFTNHLDQLTNQLNTLSEQEDFTEDKLKQFLQTLNYDEANALMEIASISQPSVTKRFASLVSGRISGWIDELR